MTSDWLRLAPTGALPQGRAVQVDVDGELVALFHTRRGFYAVSDHCQHMGGPLNEGSVNAGAVTCPWHGWRYDLSTGARVDRAGQPVTSYPVLIRDGWIYLSPTPTTEGESA